MFCAKVGWNWPRGSGEEGKKVKSLQTDDRAFSLGELKMKYLWVLKRLNPKPKAYNHHALLILFVWLNKNLPFLLYGSINTGITSSTGSVLHCFVWTHQN